MLDESQNDFSIGILRRTNFLDCLSILMKSFMVLSMQVPLLKLSYCVHTVVVYTDWLCETAAKEIIFFQWSHVKKLCFIEALCGGKWLVHDELC